MSDFIAGLNWVVTAANSSGLPSITLTAIGSSTHSSVFDAAVQNMIKNKIHFLAAAGGDGAGTPTSPRVANAIVVGAADSTGRKTAWSNYAQGIIYYYGVNIKGAWMGSTTATNTIPGTTASVRLLSGTLGSSITYRYDQVFDGYAARLSSKDLDCIRRSSDIEAIFEDGIVTIDTENRNKLAARSPTATYGEPSLSKRVNGSSVDIYEIGTGIYLQHSQFGGRAVWGATFGGYQSADGIGASTCDLRLYRCGSTYGIAKQAKLIAVKAISDSGSGTISDIIAAINWVISAVQASGRPSIAMSNIGGSANAALDSAVTNAISKGIHFVVPAGSSNVDAGNTSPARVPEAITVGAVDSSGKRASFSNYGSIVDIYYYGVNILGPAVGGVVGILALAIDKYGNQSPAALSASLKSHAKNVNGILVAQPW
ncbi:cuticle-degrading protease [Ceratobasidium sp. AG-Ba]|nr:cuticle-degrading protease [Ceratobasidium sp. AG-Ba]